MLVPWLIAVHVLGVVVWIGGVSFVTMVTFPMLLRMEGSLEKVLFFQGTEHRFARIAKIAVVIVGVSGGWLLHLTGEERRLFSCSGAGPTIMLLVWTFYVLVLMFEARLFKIIFRGGAQQDTARVFRKLAAFHWVVLGLSFLAIFVGVLGGHGGLPRM